MLQGNLVLHQGDKKESSEVDLHSPSSCWIEETFQKECRFGELQL